jgi:hypothetical protein
MPRWPSSLWALGLLFSSILLLEFLVLSAFMGTFSISSAVFSLPASPITVWPLTLPRLCEVALRVIASRLPAKGRGRSLVSMSPSSCLSVKFLLRNSHVFWTDQLLYSCCSCRVPLTNPTIRPTYAGLEPLKVAITSWRRPYSNEYFRAIFAVLAAVK